MKYSTFFASLIICILGLLIVRVFSGFYVGTDHEAYLSYAESAYTKSFWNLGVEPLYGLLNSFLTLLVDHPGEIIGILFSFSLFLKFLFRKGDETNVVRRRACAKE